MTPQQQEIVDTIIASRSVVSAATICDRIRSDAKPDLVKTQICYIRKAHPEIGRRIITSNGGYRWAKPKEDRTDD